MQSYAQLRSLDILAVYSLTRIAQRDHFRGILDELGTKPHWRLHVLEPRAFDETALSKPDGKPYDGYIISLPGTDEAMARLATLEAPTVLVNIDNQALLGRERNLSSVWLDNEVLGRTAAEYFLSKGRFASFGFIENADGQFYNAERKQAFGAVLKAASFSPKAFTASSDRDDLTTLMAFLRGLPKPAAVLCASEFPAILTRRACRAAGLDVPSAVALLTIDEMVAEGSDISFVRPDFPGMGRAAAQELERIIQSHGQHRYDEIVISDFEIVERHSTRIVPVAERQVAAARRAIAKQATQGLSVERLVANLGVPRRTLEANFRKATGRTLKATIDEARLREAQEQIRRGRPLASVAAETGFSSANALSKAFHRLTGQSVRQWKRTEDER